VRFCLDDFGTGTNPFQLLDHIHADYVRIESSFMENLADNPQNQESIKHIAEQAAELGKLSIAQHVPDAPVYPCYGAWALISFRVTSYRNL